MSNFIAKLDNVIVEIMIHVIENMSHLFYKFNVKPFNSRSETIPLKIEPNKLHSLTLCLLFFFSRGIFIEFKDTLR